MIEVGTVAFDLRDAPKGGAVLALGYYTPGDGGGGTFRFAPTSAEKDNGGTVIAPAQGDGRWVRDDRSRIDVRWFGAVAAAGWIGATQYNGPVPANVNDDAFARAIRSMTPDLLATATYHGPWIYVPPGKYEFADTLAIDRAVELVGAGSQNLASSWLHFPIGKDCVRIYQDIQPAPPSATQQPRGHMSRISRMWIGSSAAAAGPGHGIVLNATCAVEDVYVSGVGGNGVHSDCSVPATNANLSALTRVRVSGAKGHGFYTKGSDSNAMQIIGCNATSNGGWGFLDESFLGNFYFGCHTAGNVGGSYKTTSDTGCSVFFGCYSEGDQKPAEVMAPSIVIGGLMSNGGTGGWLADADGAVRIRRGMIEAKNALDAARVIYSKLGSEQVGGVARELRSGATGQHVYREKYGGSVPPGLMPCAGWWGMEADGSSFGSALRWCTPDAPEWAAQKPGGKAWLPQGYYIGNALNARVYVGVGTSAPTSGTWTKGDRIENVSPSSGGWAGWICVGSGTPGDWKPYGAIA